MSEARQSIQHRLQALASRERTLVAARALLQLLGALGLASSLAVLAAQARLPDALGLVALALLFGVLPLVALLVPSLARLRRAADPLRQAQRVELMLPALRGRLLTLAERPEGARAGESAALLERAAHKAWSGIGALQPSEVHPLAPLRRTGAWTLLLLVAALACGWVGPFNLGTAIQQLLRGGTGQVLAAEPRAEGEALPEALLGDIVLRYSYPSYTGLDPLEVPNSTGDVHGPPGTVVEIKARTAVSCRSAELHLALDQPDRDAEPPGTSAPLAASATPARVEGGRDLLASFELSAAGSWWFVLDDGHGVQPSRHHAVVLDQDLAPEVLLDAPEGLVPVAWDQPLPGSWTARDDFGLLRVEARLLDADEDQAQPLRRPLDPVSRLEGGLSLSPGDLGLLPGSEGSVVVVAWDNDAVSGSKAGVSRPLRVRVLGPRGQSQRRLRLIRQLRDTLLVLLADHLEDDWPPGPSAGELRAWGAQSTRRMDPLEELLEQGWNGFDPGGFEGDVVEAVQRSHSKLVGFIQVLGGSSQPVSEGDLATTSELRDDSIEAIELGVLTLDRVVQARAMQALEEQVALLGEEGERLQARRDAAEGELLARLDRLERQLDHVETAVDRLHDSNLATFTGHRLTDARNLAATTRQAFVEERPERGRAYLERLARNLQDFAEQFEQLRQRRQQAEDDAADQLRLLRDELRALEQEQRSLADSLLDAVKQAGDPADALAGRWRQLAKRAAVLAESLEALSVRLEEMDDRPVSEWRLAQGSAVEARGLADAIDARDLRRGLEAAAEVEWDLLRLQQTVERHARSAAIFELELPGQQEVEQGLTEVATEAQGLREAIERLLRQLAGEPAAMRSATRPLREPQAGLAERTAAAHIQARQLAPMLPMQAPGLLEGIGRAESEMASSDHALERGRALEGEGAMQAAAEGLDEAARALEQAMQQMKEMGGASDGGSDGGSDERDRRDLPEPQRVEIPAPEEFSTPEEYRRALLRGMQGDVPPEYEALKRRYYEDLVRQ